MMTMNVYRLARALWLIIMKVTPSQDPLAINLSLSLSRQSITDSQSSDEEWCMRKSEFYATVTPIMSHLAQL